MASSLKALDPTLKQYLKQHQLPEIYEALLSGLIIMCPDDPHTFIVEKLLQIKYSGVEELEWDSFIAEEMRPKSKVLGESNLDSLFDIDESLQPTPEMYKKAYTFYNFKLKTVHYNAWRQYRLQKLIKRGEFKKKLNQAALYHRQKILKTNLLIWLEWLRYRKGRQAMAFSKLQHVDFVSVGRIIFGAWRGVTLDAKHTREYFDRLERGENMETEEDRSKNTGESRDDISSLPRSVAIKIFSFVDLCDLARCACVCRSWKILTEANSLWSRLDLTKVRYRPGVGYERDWITDKVATKLLFKCRPYLVHVNLRACTGIGSPTFVSIKECRNLQDLNLSQCPSLDDERMNMIAEGCKILLYLNVSKTNITDASFRSISRHCNNLQYINFSYCLKFTDRGLLYIANGKGAKKIVYLDLSGCLQITSEGFNFFSSNCSNIHSLVLDELPTLTDECIEPIMQHCHAIKMISLLGSSNLSDESFKRISSSKKLRKLKIESNQKLSDSSMKLLGKNCPELRHVYITNCQTITDLSLKSLALCRHITVLNLADCVRITEVGVRYIVESSCGPKIRELNLTNCVRVGDLALVNINKRCHNLNYLSVCFCEHISEAGIELLGLMSSLVSLDISGCLCGDQGLSSLGKNVKFKNVNLSECTSITDLGLQKFSQQCREIERLDISHCQLLTDASIKNLAFCCRMLTFLNISGCKLLTDLSIQYVSGVCHYISHLDISGCLHISDKSMRYLRKGCSSLTVLVMYYCKNVSKNAYHKMMRFVRDVYHSEEDVPTYFNY